MSGPAADKAAGFLLMNISKYNPIWLASFPRSGNTFVRQVLFEAFGCLSYTVYENEEQTAHFGGYLGGYAGGSSVLFVKTHSMRVTEMGGRIWHIYRDGRDAFTSFRKMQSTCKDDIGVWGDYIDAVHSAADVSTSYEDLVLDPIGEVKKALIALNVDSKIQQVSEQLSSFEDLQKRNPEFWRRGKVGSHIDEMDDVAEFCRRNGRQLRQLGYV
jgi:hypothetical protein